MQSTILDYNYKKFNFLKFFKNNQRIDNINYYFKNYPKNYIMAKIDIIKKKENFLIAYKKFIKEEIQKLFNFEIVFQKQPNIRLLYPNDVEGAVPYHCDKWYHHSSDEINFWLPLHNVSKSESLQIVNLDHSKKLIKKILKEKLDYNEINKLISIYAKPVICDYGKMLKFSPLHLHGNATNRTEFPRLSIDFRVKKLNSKFESKTLGGYFEIVK